MGNKGILSKSLLRYGTVIKRNDFNTVRGYYTIRIIKWEGALYFHKMKEGVVVEIKKLT